MAYVGRTTSSRGIDPLRRTTPGSSNRAALSSPAFLRDHVSISRPVPRFNITDSFRRHTVAIATATVGTIGSVAAFLTPSTALAAGGKLTLAELGSFAAANPGTVAAVAIGATAALFIAHKVYFNPDSRYGAKPGDPTPRRIFKKFLLPSFIALTTVGMGVYGAWALSGFLNVSTAYVALTTIGGGIAYALLRSAISIGKEVRQRMSGIQPRLEEFSFKNRVTTTLINRFATFTTLFLTGYVSMTVAQITFGSVGNMFVNLANWNIGAAGPLIGLGLATIFNLGYRRTVSKLVNNLRHSQKIRWNLKYIAVDLAVGLGAGILLGAMGTGFAINLLLAAGFLWAVSHGALHSTGGQAAAHRVEETPEDEFSQEEIELASFTPGSPFMHVLKPAFSGEIKTPLWPMIFAREQTNWMVSQPNGNNMFKAYAKAYNGGYQDHEAYMGAHNVYAMLRAVNAGVRLVLQKAHSMIWASPTREAAIQATMDLCQEMARITDEASEGIIPNASRSIRRMTGDAVSVGPGTFMSGHRPDPGNGYFEDPFITDIDGRVWTNEHKAYLADIMRTWAVFYRGIGVLGAKRLENYLEMLNNNTPPGMASLTTKDIQTEMSMALECEFRRHHVPFQLLPFMLWENVYPDLDLTKIEKSDKVYGFTRYYGTCISVIRRDRATGRFYMELLPTRMHKDIRANQGQRMNITSGPNEDNRRVWVIQAEHEMGESHSDIAWVDDTEYFRTHPERYPTGDVHERERLGAGDYHDFYFQDGSKQRIFGNGRVVPYDSNNSVISAGASSNALAASADPIVWFAGGPEPALGTLTPRCPPLTRQYKDVPHYEWLRQPCFRPQMYFFPKAPYFEVCDKEQADFLSAGYLADHLQNQFVNWAENLRELLWGRRAGRLEDAEQRVYLKIQWKIPERVATPFDPQLKDSRHDQLLQVPAQAVSWFILKVRVRKKERTVARSKIPADEFEKVKGLFADPNAKLLKFNPNIRKEDIANLGITEHLKDILQQALERKQRTLYLPYNVRKDGMPWWVDIDETQGLNLVRVSEPNNPSHTSTYLQAVFKTGSKSLEAYGQHVYMRSTSFLDQLSDYVVERIDIDLGRGRVSPLHLVKFTYLRRNDQGKIVFDGKEIEDDEFETMMQPNPPAGNSMGVLPWRHQRRRLIEQTIYERFLPMESFMKYFDPRLGV